MPSVEALPGCDIAAELARISSRLDSMNKERQGPGQYHAETKVYHLVICMQVDLGHDAGPTKVDL
ncbi:hypothetical protein CCR75_004773 [Bremia lactucae]|uniref:Uncharacterized protein n=1 Tax=Bremia lactucae TaxID=4779 RepID=A0A976FM26_BRELC|nr:hypothetical protein CCR75_004325 [Bremia lactucae]TDH69073.1 hypothetical protein CCR75_005164 [Bremia lactucae]TDH69753.1 hypothetical protein CCR75_001302 [Bremia lactucae]TDH69853.1 hypothetical protein CCR75_004773 [Bremia lactucae]